MSDSAESVLNGIAAAPGLALGPAFQFRRHDLTVPHRTGVDLATELQRLEQARDQARHELEQLASHANATIRAEESEIFAAHSAFLDDPAILEEIESLCAAEGCNSEYAVAQVFDQYSALLASDDDPLFQARAADLNDVKQRLIRILLGVSDTGMALPSIPSIIIANDLLPSETVRLERSLTLALCTAIGGATSHVAILARGMGLPTIVGLGEQVEAIPDGTLIAVDGHLGQVHRAPSAATQQWISEQIAAEPAQRQQMQASAHLPATTSDGVRLSILANVSSVAEAHAARQHGAEGVGLLRTELLFIDRQTAPSEGEQLGLYRAIAEALGRQPLTIRTLDIGADKPVNYIAQPVESNPALGQRGIRLALAKPELLRTQLRAIWRIGPGFAVKVMFPMVANLEEIIQLRHFVEQARAELVLAGEPILDTLDVGIMVEVPSIAIQARHAAPLVDFFSIGTNDLTQYTLAVDRTNAAVSALGDAFNPAVLNLIAQTARAGQEYGKPVGVCGELAGDPLATAMLLGMGIGSLSMAPAMIPAIKAIVRNTSAEQAAELASHVLAQSTTEAVRRVFARNKSALEHDRNEPAPTNVVTPRL